MGRFALIVLILVSFFFLFVKPYLTLKRVQIHAEGLSIHEDRSGFDLKLAYVYLPIGKKLYFLGVENLKVYLSDRVTVGADEVILISVGEGKAERRRPPRFPIPSFLREWDVEFKNLFLTSVGRGFIWVYVWNFRLKQGDLKGDAIVRVGSRAAYVKVKEAKLLSKGVLIKSADIVSDTFSLSLRGFLSDRAKGRFRIEGHVGPVEGRNFLVNRVRISGEGDLRYGSLTAKVRAHTDLVRVKGRKDFENVRATALVRIRFGKDLVLSGRVWNRDLSGSYKLKIMPRRVLEVSVHRFVVDNEILRVRDPILSEVSGEVFLDMDRRRVLLSLVSDRVVYRDMTFREGSLHLDYSYDERTGTLDLSLRNPGDLALRGDVYGKTFSGDLILTDIPVVRGDISTHLSYRGSVTYKGGKLDLIGRGNFKDLRWRDAYLGDGEYRLVLIGDSLQVSFQGEGSEGYVKGSLRGDLFSEVTLRGFNLRYGDVRVEDLRGNLEASRTENRIAIGLKIRSGRLTREGLETDISGDLVLTVEGNSKRGSFSFDLTRVRYGDRSFGGGSVKGKVTGDTVTGTIEIENLARGDFKLNLKDKILSGGGSFGYGKLVGQFDLRVGVDRGRFSLRGFYSLGRRKVPLSVEGRYSGGKFSLEVKPVRYKVGVADLVFGGAGVEGDLERARLTFRGARLDLLGETLVVVRRSEGIASPKERRLDLHLPYSGGLEGDLRISLSGGRIRTSLAGRADLERISFLTATPTGSRATGDLLYSLAYEGGDLTVHVETEEGSKVYSKYLSIPMGLNFSLEARGRSMAAFLGLWHEGKGVSANLGTENLKDYYVYVLSKDLPLSYESRTLRTNLQVSGSGWVNVKDLREASLHMDLNLKGEVRVVKNSKRKTAKRNLPPVRLRVNFRSKEPLRIRLPEGYVYAQVRGKVRGTLAEPVYSIDVTLISGELRYFGKTFYVRSGKVSLVRTGEGEKRTIDVDLVNPGDEMNIHLSLRGDPSDPDVVVWSEPPRSVGEIVTQLIAGGSEEGAIPVSQAIMRRVGYRSIGGDLISALGIDINIITKTGSQGEIGVNLNIRKRISRFLSVEYQQSTLKDPRETFYGGGIRLPGKVSFFGRVFSDDTSEVKLRFIRKFDF